jgi:hypothetical protein
MAPEALETIHRQLLPFLLYKRRMGEKFIHVPYIYYTISYSPRTISSVRVLVTNCEGLECFPNLEARDRQCGVVVLLAMYDVVTSHRARKATPLVRVALYSLQM